MSGAINSIGREAGISLWNDLTPEKKSEEYSNDKENNYYVGKIKPSDGKYPPLLLFQSAGHHGYGRDSSIYTINLITGKPTKSSYIQIIPREELVLIVRKQIL